MFGIFKRWGEVFILELVFSLLIGLELLFIIAPVLITEMKSILGLLFVVSPFVTAWVLEEFGSSGVASLAYIVASKRIRKSIILNFLILIASELFISMIIYLL